MGQDNMLNNDAGLHEAAPVVDKHWKALQGPDACELAEVRWRIGSEHLQLKRDVVLVERNQNLLTVGREGMRIKNKFHRQRAHFVWITKNGDACPCTRCRREHPGVRKLARFWPRTQAPRSAELLAPPFGNLARNKLHDGITKRLQCASQLARPLRSPAKERGQCRSDSKLGILLPASLAQRRATKYRRSRGKRPSFRVLSPAASLGRHHCPALRNDTLQTDATATASS